MAASDDVEAKLKAQQTLMQIAYNTISCLIAAVRELQAANERYRTMLQEISRRLESVCIEMRAAPEIVQAIDKIVRNEISKALAADTQTEEPRT